MAKILKKKQKQTLPGKIVGEINGFPIRRVRVKYLRGSPYNPREIDADSLEGLSVSVSEFGLVEPIIWNRRFQRIVGGHQRCKTLDADAITDVVEVDLDETREKALNLALNNSHISGEWTIELGQILDELQTADDFGDLFQDLCFDDLRVDVPDILDDKPPAPPSDDTGSDGHDRTPKKIEPRTSHGDVVDLGRHVLHCNDCLEVMSSIEDGSIDSIVTDPPYGLGLMNKEWDSKLPGKKWANECFRLLKPGGHLIAFSGTRTYHRLATTIEDVGFEIRDQIDWLYWQGWPKGIDIAKAIDKIRGVKPTKIGFKKRSAAVAFRNSKRGDGSRTNDGCNSETWDEYCARGGHDITTPTSKDGKYWVGWNTCLKPAHEPAILARKPVESETVAHNILEHGTGALNIDGCRIPPGDPSWPGPNDEIGDRSSGGFNDDLVGGNKKKRVPTPDPGARWPANIYQCKKVIGTDRSPKQMGQQGVHPTVKPTKLMRWLIRLVTPPEGTILDPFVGSGTSLIAADIEGFSCIGIEMEPHYCDIAQARWDEYKKGP